MSHYVPPPKCPHCKGELKDWLEPSNMTAKEFFTAAFVILAVIIQFVGLIAGGMEGDFNKCQPFGTKRYHYVVLGYVPACVTVRWLESKQVFEEPNGQQ